MPLRPRRPRLPGVEVDGAAIRRARLTAGLTMAEVAAPDLTRAAIHAVETGRVRPSMPVLEQIAQRVGRPLSSFLRAEEEREAALAEVEDLGRRRHDEDVIKAVPDLLAELHQPRSRARAGLVLGAALHRSGRYAEAVEHLKSARSAFERVDDAEGILETLDWLAAALSALQDPAALPTALEAMKLSSGAASDTVARIHVNLGGIRLARHEWREAETAYRVALESGEVADLGTRARAQAGLAAALQRLGDLGAAASHLRRALALHELQHDRVAICRLENNLGLLELESGNVDSARTHVERALELGRDLRVRSGLAHVLLSLAEVELRSGDPVAAERAASEAGTLAVREGEQLSSAAAWELRARAAAAAGDQNRAAAAFEQAAVILRSLGASERLAGVHTSWSFEREDAGDLAGALHHMRNALAAIRPELVGDAQAAGSAWQTA